MEKGSCGTRLCAGALGSALAITFALAMIVFGLLAWHFKVGSAWATMVSSVYVGFALTPKGIAIGALYALVEGFVIGLVIAWLYNLCAKCCKCKACEHKAVEVEKK
ncbi:MAG: hypothetical protein ACHQJ6_07020 [Candidatus Berkiellales bacterium]